MLLLLDKILEILVGVDKCVIRGGIPVAPSEESSIKQETIAAQESVEPRFSSTLNCSV